MVHDLGGNDNEVKLNKLKSMKLKMHKIEVFVFDENHQFFSLVFFQVSDTIKFYRLLNVNSILTLVNKAWKRNPRSWSIMMAITQWILWKYSPETKKKYGTLIF